MRLITLSKPVLQNRCVYLHFLSAFAFYSHAVVRIVLHKIQTTAVRFGYSSYATAVLGRAVLRH